MADILRPWMAELPLRMQSTLLLALRGPDGMPKECAAKILCREYRYVVVTPRFPRELFPGKTGDDFMGTQTGYCSWDVVEDFKEHHDEYPHHWLMHLIHGAEIIGQFHPNTSYRDFWFSFYVALCHAFHMNPETLEQLSERLG